MVGGTIATAAAATAARTTFASNDGKGLCVCAWKRRMRRRLAFAVVCVGVHGTSIVRGTV
eukprot:3845052-Pleurochrysis_carterae.AAC.2